MATIRLGKRTEQRSPLIRDFVPLAELDDIVFGAWDPIPDDAYTAAKKAGVLEEQDLEPVADFLRGIKPMPAVFDYALRHAPDGERTSRRARPSATWPSSSARTSATSRHGTGATDSLWSGAHRPRRTSRPGPQHATIEQFERAMERNDDAIAPSMLYAWASIMEGVPYCNGAPNLCRRHAGAHRARQPTRASRSPARISRPARRG